MAKGKLGVSVQNRPLYSRLSFLHQAASYLALINSQELHEGDQRDFGPSDSSVPLQGLSRQLATDLRSVSLKTRIRLDPAVKQFLCKYCDSVLIEGVSCTTFVENKSRDARKPWADIMVRRCLTCEREKRYPVSSSRPKRKNLRKQPPEEGQVTGTK
ncbi:hypothetical protein VTK73DRAFT_8965 [Phialemonium thermophilum]|uniref:Uncharacterized protein n=1 Tax=Phialemonium thermophilum TaxID=223376 RepID=A0ABR3Y5S0_9PEZI